MSAAIRVLRPAGAAPAGLDDRSGREQARSIAGAQPSGLRDSSERQLRLQRKLRVALGVIWLVDGTLQLQPFMFSKGFVTQILEPNAAGQPAILAHAIRLAAHLFEQQPVAFNAAAAALQLAIGLALLHPRSYRIGLALSVTWGLAVWCFGEGLGGLLTGTASPLTGAPGAAAAYVLVSLILWPADRAIRGSAASQGLLGDHGARFAWAALWLLAAALWLAPANLAPDAPSQAIAHAPAGVTWLGAIEHLAARTLAGDGVSVALALASVSALVGLGVLADRMVRPMLAIGALLSLICWVLGEGLGGILTGQATDLNTGPLIVLLAATLYPVERSRERPGESTAADTRP